MSFAFFVSKNHDWRLYLTLSTRTILIIVCILLIVSIWVKKSLLVIGYLIVDVILMILTLGNSIFNLCTGEILIGVVGILLIFLFIYFWIFSIWVKKSLLVIGYLIFDVILMITLLGLSIYNFCSGEILIGVVNIFLIFLFIYFWICVFSWFMELRKLEKEN
ncbi:hypothetical protein ACLKA7_004606 [Drosophila subpalustris]